MSRLSRIAILCVLESVALLCCATIHDRPVSAAEYRDEVERDFALRSIGQLQITNLRGGIVVQGWALDKIRVKARRKVEAESDEAAKKLLGALDFRYRSIDGDIELSAEYGKGLSIEERLKERQSPKTSMEMVVYAPANLKLRVWTMDGDVQLKTWKAPLEVRTAKGAIRIDDVEAESVSILCPTCTISAQNIRASLRCMGGSGEIQLKDIKGKNIYVESQTGNQKLTRVEGEQLYVSKAASVTGSGLRGHVEFHTLGGSVDFEDSAGFVSGRTEDGNISLKMKEWRFADKALLESVKGNVILSLPLDFSGEVDLWSRFGKTQLAFPYEPVVDGRQYGPMPANRLRGRIAEGKEQLRIFSQYGDIQVLRGI